MASGVTDPSRETTATDEVPLHHIDLPDDWRGDLKKPREAWCSTCLWDGVWDHLLIESVADEERFGRIFSKPILSASASEGNLCCAVLSEFLQKANGGKYDWLRGTWSYEKNAFVRFGFEQRNCEPVGESIKKVRFWKLLTAGSAPAPPGICDWGLDELPSLDTGSRRSVAWVKDRINECRQDHPNCHSRTTSTAPDGYIPSRLLYIPADPIEGIVLRLRYSVPSGARYVALSHCWGSRDMWPRCLTTNANYESQLKCIPWDTLPQTFRDTIIFARKLGLEFVWIDSMCIIQGDEKDWQRESTQMFSVYSNAFITFAALHAHDSHGGLFSQRAPGSLVPLLTLGYRGKQYQVEAFSVPDELEDFEDQSEDRMPADRPHALLNRAWAFQERVVSARVLYFGREELIWECPTGRSCEEDQYSHISWGEMDVYGTPNRPYTLMQKYSTISNTTKEMALQWLEFVKLYNDLQLSEPTDRLPAISAIAQRFAQCNPNDEYLCGLWRNSMHLGLTMTFNPHESLTSPHMGPGPPAAEQPRYIAPSWSWASCQGRLWGGQELVSHLAKIVKVSLRYVDNSRFGRIASGSSITIRGPVLDCVWDLRFNSDGTLQTRQSLSIQCTAGTKSFEFLREYATYSDIRPAEQVDVCLLFMGIEETGNCAALILRRLGAGGPYFRVGILSGFYRRSGGKAVGGWLARAFFEQGSVRECVIE